MSDEWRKLIERYKCDRTICNCGNAYYSMTGESLLVRGDGKPNEILYNQPVCQYGCQANQYAVKDEIAKKVFEELGQL